MKANPATQALIDSLNMLNEKHLIYNWTDSVKTHMESALRRHTSDGILRTFSTVQGMSLSDFLNASIDPTRSPNVRIAESLINAMPSDTIRNIGVFCDFTRSNFNYTMVNDETWEVCVISAATTRNKKTGSMVINEVFISQTTYANVDFLKSLRGGGIDLGEDHIALYLFTDKEASDMVGKHFSDIRAINEL
ncbi:MAG: hypothetical protein CMF22_11810 [Idiomarinaceae bacterium]|nr:hypothetical protein [Idiomarinaceae bacterium]|tara:strand:+ start:39419 stop:39994 length:576 start_codon:yes stop_codon:yes gene_type:complete